MANKYLNTKQKIRIVFIVLGIVLSIATYIYATYFAPTEEYTGDDSQSTLFSENNQVADPKYSYHFIDVGQGDATLILSEKGSVLVDAGPGDHAIEAVEYIRTLTDTIDYLIITHPHEDHIGGADDIIKAYNVGNVIMPDMSVNTVVFTKMLDAIELKGCNVYEAKPGDVYNSSDIRIDILGPSITDDDNLNNISVFTKITTGEVTAMFTGDAEIEAENALLKMYDSEDLAADIFQAGHHGSTTSNSVKLLNAISPEYAVISCGKNNTYGHPHDEIIKRFEDRGILQYRTDTMGSIVFVTDGKNIDVSVSYT